MKVMSMPEIQRALMGLSPEYQEKFYYQRDKFFDETDFTFPLPDNFDHYRFFIGCHTNEIILGISAKTYNSLFYSKSIERYSVGNMASICQGSESTTFYMYIQSFGKKEGANPTAEWCYMREAFEVVTAQVNSIIEPAMTQLLKKLAIQQNAIIKAGNHDTGNYKEPKKIHLQ